MALTTPTTANEVIDRAVNDVFSAMSGTGAKPSLRNSWINALIRALALRVFDFYYELDRAALEVFPDTAVQNLDRIAAIWGLTRTAGQTSGGLAVVNGTAGKVIAATTVLSDGVGNEYSVGADATITTKNPTVTTILRYGQTALLSTSSAHGITTPNVRITVTGCTEVEYNVTNALVYIVSPTILLYAISGSPSSPATGSPVLAYSTANITLESNEFSDDADLDYLDVLTFQSPITGVDDTAVVDEAGTTGGLDRETDIALRARLLDRIHNPVAHFNVADIARVAKAVAGVTRVFVYEITPQLGMVTVYFMRDDDASPIPDSSEVAEVKAALDDIRPANTKYEDLIVLAPTAKPIDFTFTDLQPATSTMATAVKASLAEFFAERTSVGETLKSDAYRSAIFNTVDTNDGSKVTSFTLSSPVGDQAMAASEIPTLGSISGI